MEINVLKGEITCVPSKVKLNKHGDHYASIDLECDGNLIRLCLVSEVYESLKDLILNMKVEEKEEKEEQAPAGKDKFKQLRFDFER